MATIVGRVSEYDPSNVIVGGKIIFVPPEDRVPAQKNFPPGSFAKVTVEKGTARSMVAPSKAEIAQAEADEARAKSQVPGQPPAPAKEPENAKYVTGEFVGTPGKNVVLKVDGSKNTYSCGSDLLLKYLNAPDCPIKPGDMVRLGLLDDRRGDGLAAAGIERIETQKQDPAPVLKTAAELKKEEQPAPQEPCTSPAATGTVKEITLSATVNLNNYENLRIEATATDFLTARACLIDSLRALGTQSAVTREIVEKYIQRTFGGA